MKLFKKIIGTIIGISMALGIGFTISNNSSKAIPVHAAGTTVSYSLSSTGWENQSQHETLLINEHLTAIASSGSNTGKFYTSDNSWRFYANESATLTILGDSAVSSIDSIILTFSVKDSGIVKYGDTNITSGTAIAVSGTSIAFSISQSSGSKGKVFFTTFSITYTPSSTPIETHSIIFNANGDNVTDMPDNLTGQSGTVSLTNISSPSRPGYIFSGWSLTADGEVISSVTITNADVDVYAIWETEPTPVSNSYKFFKLTSVDDVTAGKYVIVANTGSAYMAMPNTFASKINGVAITVTNDIITDDMSNNIVTIEKVGSNIAITDGSKYLGYGTSGTNFTFSQTTSEDSKQQWSVSLSEHAGTFHISNVSANNRGIIYNTDTYNRFGAYAGSNVDDSNYYDIELFRAFTAEDFAGEIINKITCNASGTSAPTYVNTSWTGLKTIYTTKLTEAQQEILQEADAIEGGNVIQQAIAKYDYIVGKYDYENFMHRNPAPVGRSNLANVILSPAATTNTFLVITLSTATILLFVSYFVFKKKKEN